MIARNRISVLRHTRCFSPRFKPNFVDARCEQRVPSRSSRIDTNFNKYERVRFLRASKFAASEGELELRVRF